MALSLLIARHTIVIFTCLISNRRDVLLERFYSQIHSQLKFEGTVMELIQNYHVQKLTPRTSWGLWIEQGPTTAIRRVSCF